MNTDERASLLRAVFSVLAGAAILSALGAWLGWWTVALIAAAGAVEWVWGELQLPSRWRPW